MAIQQKVDLVGVGLNATDTVIHVSSFPECGSKVEYEAEHIMLGGQVASTVIACQTWGLRTRYVGKLGDDEASRLHTQEFLRAGTEAHLTYVPSTPSARSLILLDSTGERTVLCRRDERLTLQPAELKREWIVNARALHVDGHDTAAATLAARWAREAGVLVTADLDDTYEGIDELLKNIDFLIVNHDFPLRLTGEPDLKTALREMQRRFGSRLAAATLGHDGVIAWDGEQFHYAPAFRVPVVDTTGAGDIFRAASSTLCSRAGRFPAASTSPAPPPPSTAWPRAHAVASAPSIRSNPSCSPLRATRKPKSSPPSPLNHLLQRLQARVDIRIHRQKAIRPRHLNQLRHPLGHSAKPQLPTLLLRHPRRLHQRPQARAVHVRNRRHIQHHLAGSILDRLLQLRVRRMQTRTQRQRTP